MSYILIVEDDPHIRRFIRVNLTARGFKVIEADTGEDALNYIYDDPPILVLLDIMLPGMSGLDLLGMISQDERYKSLPVVLISAWVKEQSSDIRMTYPQVAATIPKPLSVNELVTTVRSILNGSSPLEQA